MAKSIKTNIVKTNTDEGSLLFEIQRGVCAVGCGDCYERGASEKFVGSAIEQGFVQGLIVPINSSNLSGLNTAALYRLQRKAEKAIAGLPLSLQQMAPQTGLMSLEEITSWFSLMNEVGLTRADLIGSETTEHPYFSEILDTAREHRLAVLVYTGRLPANLDRLRHPAVTNVMLHLDYTAGVEEKLKCLVDEGKVPSDDYMKRVNILLEQGKQVDLRINFPYRYQQSMDQSIETGLVFNFLAQIDSKYRDSVRVKYSFSTKVGDALHLPHFELDTFDTIVVTSFLSFVDRVKDQYPNVALRAERPLFKCTFSDEQWNDYEIKAGLRSTCNMEIAAYPGRKLGLCTVTRELGIMQQIDTADTLCEGVEFLRNHAAKMFELPSFPQCEPCNLRTTLACYGGCSGYKVTAASKKSLGIEL